MDLGWLCMTQVWLEEVRTSRWTSRWTSSRTSGGTSGSQMDPGRVKYGLGIIKGSFNWSIRITSRNITPNLLLRAQNLKVNPRSFELDINASQACLSNNWLRKKICQSFMNHLRRPGDKRGSRKVDWSHPQHSETRGSGQQRWQYEHRLFTEPDLINLWVALHGPGEWAGPRHRLTHVDLAAPGLPHHHLHWTFPKINRFVARINNKRSRAEVFTSVYSGLHGGSSDMRHSLQPAGGKLFQNFKVCRYLENSFFAFWKLNLNNFCRNVYNRIRCLRKLNLTWKRILCMYKIQ